MQKLIVIRIFRTTELGKIHFFPGFALMYHIAYKLCRKALSEGPRILYNVDFLIQKLPDCGRQLIMFHQKTKQISGAIFLFLQRKKVIRLKKRFPFFHITAVRNILIDLPNTTYPLSSRSIVLQRRFRLLVLFCIRRSGIAAGLLISHPQSLEAFRIILRIRYRQLVTIGILQCPFVFCLFDSQNLKHFDRFHAVPSTVSIKVFVPIEKDIKKEQKNLSAPE